MTQKQFKEALLCGQGRCVQAVRTDPAKYYSIVLWACSHTVAFDAQCEGTKAWFVYQLISCYQDQKPFLDAIIASLHKTKSDGGWKVLYLAELLNYFSYDGARDAERALCSKYEELYHALLRKKKNPGGIFPERDDFAMLCQVLADEKGAMVKIAEDIGNLYLSNDLYDGGDFDWLFAVIAKRHMRTLRKLAQKSERIAEYLRVGEADIEAFESSSQKRAQDPERYRSGRSLSLWLKHKADQETVLRYAKGYLEQEDPKARAEALEAFGWCPFPEEPFPIIEDTKSAFEPLRKAAWQALENIRHALVREFALERLDSDLENALPVFITNYQQQDEALLVERVKSIPVEFECTTAWHGIHRDILAMEDYKLKAPPALLRHIYETTYCSCCREDALRQMGKRRLLNRAILEECLLDSNYDIRAYAARCLKRRRT